MTAGKLRKRLVIEQPTAVRNSYGENVPTYSTIATIWASIEPLSGRQQQLMQASSLTATATHTITVRYRTDIIEGSSRLRLGTTGTLYQSLTSSDYAALTSSDYAALSTRTGVRYFRPLAISDTGKAHRQLVITAVEVTA